MNGNTPPHLRALVSASSKGGEEAEESGLPSFDNDSYTAHARASNKPIYAIHLLKPNGKGRTFEYVDLRSRCGPDEDFSNDRFSLAFLGMRPVMVTIEGRNLLRLYDYIHQHRMPWIMEMAPDRDFAAAGIAVVSRILVAEYREPREPGT